MPEGFEQLGGEGLRDLIAYLSSDDQHFRILDMTSVFTADTSGGIYFRKENRDETLRFRRFGTILHRKVPFDIVSPTKSPTGNNVLVLKGGDGMSRNYPQSVEFKAGFQATQLHFLSGIGGWAYPFGGDSNKDKPVLKVTLMFQDGGTEVMEMRNGVEFADYIGRNDVPGSELVPDLLQGGRQVRYFSRPVQGRGVIEKIRLESFNNAVAPTVVAVTAELGDGSTSVPSATSAPSGESRPSATTVPAVPDVAPPVEAGPRFEWGGGIKTLIVGGGSSHDFHRFFNLADRAILEATGKTSVQYTETTRGLSAALRDVDVLYLSNNKPFEDEGTKQAIFRHANQGKGLLLVHAALWLNWRDWPEYNRVLSGGSSRGHDRFGEFEVTVTEPKHPLMAGLPAKFTIADELYWFEPYPDGTPIKVLATAHSPQRNQTYPILFEVLHPKAPIVGITLGHDGRAHSHPAYQRLLQNSLIWASTPRAQ
jgi:type 1 glutamine amidotransferase